MADKITIAEIRLATEKITKQLNSLKKKLISHKKNANKILTFKPSISITDFKTKIVRFNNELRKISETAKLEQRKVNKELAKIKINEINSDEIKRMADSVGVLISKMYKDSIKEHLDYAIRQITVLQTRTMEEAIPDNIINKIKNIKNEFSNINIDFKIDKEMLKLDKAFQKLMRSMKAELKQAENNAKKIYRIKIEYLEKYNRKYKEYNENVERLDRSRPQPAQAPTQSQRRLPTQPSNVPQSTFRIDIRETQRDIESVRQLFDNLKTRSAELNIQLKNQTQRMMSDYESEVEAGSRAVTTIITNAHNKEIADYKQYYENKIRLARENGQSTESLEAELNRTIETLEQQHNTRVSAIERQANQQRQRIQSENARQAQMTTEERFRREMELIVRGNREQGRFLRENQRRMRDALRDFEQSAGRFRVDPLVVDADESISDLRDLRQILTNNSRELTAIMQRETRRMQSNRVEEIQEGERNIRTALENASQNQIESMKNASRERIKIESRTAATRLQMYNREVERLKNNAEGDEEELTRIENEAQRVRQRIRADFQERRTEIEEQTNEAIERAREQHNRRVGALVRTSQRRQEEAPNEREVGRLGSTRIFSSISEEARETLGAFSGQLGGLGQALSRIHPAAMAAAAGLGAAVEAVKKGIQQYLEFEKSVNRVSTLLNESQMSGLMGAMGGLRDISRDTGFSISDLSDSLYNAISAVPQLGNNLNAATSLVEKAAKTGKALGASTEETTLAMVKFANAMGLSLESVKNQNFVLDTMANTMKLGLIPSGQELSKYFAQSAPSMSALTENTKHATLALSAMTATLTANGVQMSEAQTQIKALSNEMLKSDKRLKLVKLGIEGLSPQGLVTDWVKFAKSVSKNMEKVDSIFGSIQAKNALRIIAKDGAAAFADTFSQIEQGAGTANEMFEKMGDSGTAELQKIQTNWDDLLLTIGESASDYFIGFTKGLNSVLHTLTEWFEPAYVTSQRLEKQYDKLTSDLKSIKQVSESIDMSLTVDTASENDILFYYDKVRIVLEETGKKGTLVGEAINKILNDPTQVTIEGLTKVNELLKGIKAETQGKIIINIDENLESSADVFWEKMYRRSLVMETMIGRSADKLELSASLETDLFKERGLAEGLARNISGSLSSELDKLISGTKAKLSDFDLEIPINPDMSSIEKTEKVYSAISEAWQKEFEKKGTMGFDKKAFERLQKQRNDWEMLNADFKRDYNHFSNSIREISKKTAEDIIAYNESLDREVSDTEYLEDVKSRIIEALDIDVSTLETYGSLELFNNLVLETAKQVKGLGSIDIINSDLQVNNIVTVQKELSSLSDNIKEAQSSLADLQVPKEQEPFDYESFGLAEPAGIEVPFSVSGTPEMQSLPDSGELSSYNDKILETHRALQELAEQNKELTDSQLMELMKSADGQTELIELQKMFIGLKAESHIQDMENLASEKLAKDEINNSDIDAINQLMYSKMQEIQLATENKLSNYELMEAMRQQLEIERLQILAKFQKGDLTEEQKKKQLESNKLLRNLLGLEMQDISLLQRRGVENADLNKLQVRKNMATALETEIKEVLLKQDDASLEREIEYLKGLKKINQATIEVLKTEMARAKKYGWAQAKATAIVTEALKLKTSQELEFQKAVKGSSAALLGQGEDALSAVAVIQKEINNLQAENKAIDTMISDRENRLNALGNVGAYKGGTGSDRLGASGEKTPAKEIEDKSKDAAKELQEHLRRVAQAIEKGKEIDANLQDKLSDLVKKQKEEEIKELYRRAKAERAYVEKLRKIEEKRIDTEYGFIEKLENMLDKISEKTLGFAESSSDKLRSILDKLRPPNFSELFNRSVANQLSKVEEFRESQIRKQGELENQIFRESERLEKNRSQATQLSQELGIRNIVDELLKEAERLKNQIRPIQEALEQANRTRSEFNQANLTADIVAEKIGNIDVSGKELTESQKGLVQRLDDLLRQESGRNDSWISEIREIITQLSSQFPEIKDFIDWRSQKRTSEQVKAGQNPWVSVLQEGSGRHQTAIEKGWDFIEMQTYINKALEMYQKLKGSANAISQGSANAQGAIQDNVSANLSLLDTQISGYQSDIKSLENQINELLRKANLELDIIDIHVDRSFDNIGVSENVARVRELTKEIENLGFTIDESTNSLEQNTSTLEALEEKAATELPIAQVSALAEATGGGINDLIDNLRTLQDQFREAFDSDYVKQFVRQYNIALGDFRKMRGDILKESKIDISKILEVEDFNFADLKMYGEFEGAINEIDRLIKNIEESGEDTLTKTLEKRLSDLIESGASIDQVNVVRQKIKDLQEDNTGLLVNEYIEEEVGLLEDQKRQLTELKIELDNIIDRTIELGRYNKTAFPDFGTIGWDKYLKNLDLAKLSISEISRLQTFISNDVEKAYGVLSNFVEKGKEIEASKKPDLEIEDYIEILELQKKANLELIKSDQELADSGNEKARNRIEQYNIENDKINLLINQYSKYKETIIANDEVIDSLKEIESEFSELQFKEEMGYIKASERIKKEIELLKEKSKHQKGEEYDTTIREIKTKGLDLEKAELNEHKESINEVASAIDGWNTALEEVEKSFEKIGEISSLIESGRSGKAVGAIGDLQTQIGKALLKAPYPLDVMGAVLLGSGLVMKVFGKFISLFQQHEKSNLELAKERSNAQKAILQTYNDQIDALIKLNELGEESVNNAWKLYLAEKEIFEQRLRNDNEWGRFADMENEERQDFITNTKSELNDLKSLLDSLSVYDPEETGYIERTGIIGSFKDELSRFGVNLDDYTSGLIGGISKSDWKSIIDDLETFKLGLEGDLGTAEEVQAFIDNITSTLENAKSQLQDYFNMRIDLITDLQISDSSIVDAANDMQDFYRTELTDSLNSVLPDIDWSGMSDEELKQSVLDIISGVSELEDMDISLSPEQLEDFKSWLASLENAEEALSGLADSQIRISELRNKIDPNDEMYLSEQESIENILETLRKQLENAYAIEASEEYILGIKAKIYEYEQKINELKKDRQELDDSEIMALARYRNELVRRARLEGGISNQERQSIDSVTDRIRDRLTELGVEPSEIQRIINSMNLQTAHTGLWVPGSGEKPYLLEGGERVVSNKEVNQIGKKMLDSFIAGNVRPSSSNITNFSQANSQIIESVNIATVQDASAVWKELEPMINDNWKNNIVRYERSKNKYVS